MIGKMLGHYQNTHANSAVSKSVWPFLTAAVVAFSVVFLEISAMAWEQEASAAPLIVSRLADTDDGSCDADCSLREAIGAAAPNGSIEFASGLTGTITLGSTLTISKNVNINGPSAKGITISGNKAVRVFYVDPDVHFTIKNLTVTRGYIKGAQGSDSGLCEHGEIGGTAEGGGLYNNRGVVTIINSTFSDNRAIGGTGGSPLFPSLECTIPELGTIRSLYGRGGVGKGGAIFSSGTLSLLDSSLWDNQAIGGTGARPRGPGGHGAGGALYATGKVFVYNSTFSNNEARGMGAIYGSGDGLGGALYAMDTVFLVNSTFSGNNAKGGAGGINSSFIGGSPQVGGGLDGGNGYGGAIYCAHDTWAGNCTFANNAAKAGMPGFGFQGNSAAVGSGGAIYRPGTFVSKNTLEVNRSGAVTVKNTLIANSSSGGNCDGEINSEGYNLDSDGTCGLKAAGDISKVNPGIGSLKSNGGATFTHALLQGSPAINAGNPAGCMDHDGVAIATDQRGRNRSGRCDIGAFEVSR
jgi:CSLREA domain-containing protein